MKNLKDIATTIAGLMGSYAFYVGEENLKGKVLPSWVNISATICGLLAPSIIGYFSGKNPDGTTKTPDQLK